MSSLSAIFTRKFFKVILALYLGSFFLIWITSSPLAKHFISPFLAAQQLQLSEQASIRFNPFLMRLTLSDIELFSNRNDKKEAVFSLKELSIQVTLWRLIFDKIVLSDFFVEEGYLTIHQHANGLIVAGILIPNNVNTDNKQAPENKEKNSENFPYQLVLPQLLVNKFDIEISTENNQLLEKIHHIEIEQLSLNKVKATQTNQQASLALNALIDNTQLALTANADLTSGQGKINSEVRVDNYPVEKFAHYLEQLTELKGSLSFLSKQSVQLDKQGMNFSVEHAKLSLDHLLLGMADKHFHLEKLENNIKNLAVDLQDNHITHLAGNSNVKLTKAAIKQPQSKATIAAFKQLNLADINFALNQGPSIDITDVVLDEIIFSKKASLSDEAAKKTLANIKKLSQEEGLEIAAQEIVKLPAILKLKQLTLNNLKLNEKSINIDSIIFDALTSAVIIKKNKDIANLVALNNDSDTNEEEKEKKHNANAIEPANSEKNDSFTFSFNALRFINNSRIDFTDFSVDPVYQRTFFIDTLELGALSNITQHQDNKTPFTLTGRSNKYATFNLAGFLQPFTDLPSYHIAGDFKEFSLPAISSYIKDSTGLVIKTGQLNTDLNVTLSGEQLSGNIVVLLQALQTGFVDSEEAGNLIDQGVLPLNMALGMLKDSNGNVELDVPISGSTSDPQFGLSSIVSLITQKAIMSATQDYLMTTFVPYANIVSLAMTAGEFALKLRFDDLVYQDKQIEPDNKQSAYLNDFIALMQEKEDIRVVICAISTPADIDLKAGAEVTDKAAIKRLLKVGEEREHALKDYLIEEGDIDSSRILFCKPQIDSTEGAIPRIKISV